MSSSFSSLVFQVCFSFGVIECALIDVDLFNLCTDVDVSELEEHIQFPFNEKLKNWLIEALRSFTAEQRVKFIQFVTGSSSLPVGGIKNLSPQLNVELVLNDDDQLPSAHTCFNTLDLPLYSSADVLKEKLLLAITEGFEGFDNV